MRAHVARLPEYYPIEDEPAKRVLVIDDEARIREIYRLTLLSTGFEVRTAPNAVEAQNLLVRNKFDIILLDINMAEVDGSVLFEIIRAFHKKTKVVVSSVYSVDEQKERIKEADGYFDKSEGSEAMASLVASLS